MLRLIQAVSGDSNRQVYGWPTSLKEAVPLIGGQIATSSETSEVAFVSVDQLGAYAIHPSMRLRIEHGLSNERRRPTSAS
jgi:hypothetical protein